jgi:uncharacterized protein YecT (DUF1311 family)
MRIKKLLFVVLSCAAGPLFANDCLTQTDEAATRSCLAAAQAELDGQLQSLTATIDARLAGDAETKGLFTTAQTAWTAYRDAECTFSSSGVSGGSVYPLIYGLCIQTLTQARIDGLKPYLACVEGDMGCPVPGQ